jgi:hypothetical protein
MSSILQSKSSRALFSIVGFTGALACFGFVTLYGLNIGQRSDLYYSFTGSEKETAVISSWLIFATSVVGLAGLIVAAANFFSRREVEKAVSATIFSAATAVLAIGLSLSAMEPSKIANSTIEGYLTIHGPLVTIGFALFGLGLLTQLILELALGKSSAVKGRLLAGKILGIIAAVAFSFASGFGLDSYYPGWIATTALIFVGLVLILVFGLVTQSFRGMGVAAGVLFILGGLPELFLSISWCATKSSNYWPSGTAALWIPLSGFAMWGLGSLAIGIHVLTSKPEAVEPSGSDWGAGLVSPPRASTFKSTLSN